MSVAECHTRYMELERFVLGSFQTERQRADDVVQDVVVITCKLL